MPDDYESLSVLQLSELGIRIDEDILASVVDTQGSFFASISGVDARKIARDLLDPRKAMTQADLVQRHVQLSGKKVLEIGCGLGINLMVWTKAFNVDAYGVEPDAPRFDASHALSTQLFQRHGLDSSRIIPATGEDLPFGDDTFDVVYSTNVLEHSDDPVKVLGEALRVLKPGGVLQFVYPNYRSFFDGHYAVFHPPVLWSGFFPWYVQNFFNRDPAFARTLRTELNVAWTRHVLQELSSEYSFTILSLGQDIFMERMRTINFESYAGLGKVKDLVSLARRLRLNTLAGKCMLAINAFTPIILTMKKLKG